MQRLIDANALIKIYEGWVPQLMLPEDAGDKRGVETCIKVLQDTPTIDAVEVVRCKNCKYHKDTSVPEYKHCYMIGKLVWHNAFCYYGESITEDKNNGNNSN